MSKKISIPLLGIIFIGLILGANPISAQEELPQLGITPDSPFYFIERFFEGVGTLFTFGDLNKAERYANLTAKRIAEAQAMAEKNNSEAVDKALLRYEEQIQKAIDKTEQAKNKGEKIERITEIMARNTNRHILVLEKVLEKTPEQAKEAIERVREMSMEKQKNILMKLSEENPEKATEINMEMIESRINKIRERAEENNVKEVEKNIEEFKNRCDFGEEISQIAQQLGKDTTALEQLISRASSIHLEILSDIYEKIPEQAKETIEEAMENSIKGREKAIESLKNKGALEDIAEKIFLPEKIKERIQQRIKNAEQILQEPIQQKTQQQTGTTKQQTKQQVQQQTVTTQEQTEQTETKEQVEPEPSKTTNYPETVTILGETKLVTDIIAEERARIEKDGYQSACIERVENLKKYMVLVDEETANTLLKIIDDLCQEYK